MQAIKCCVALLQQQSMLPSDEAAVRLNLARLLLAHTLNVADAKQHLQKAVRACCTCCCNDGSRSSSSTYTQTTCSAAYPRADRCWPSLLLLKAVVRTCPHLSRRVLLGRCSLPPLQDMLAAPLPGQQLLKCEVLAALGDAHKLLGEADFQRRCYAKGLEVCKHTGGTAGASSDT